MAGADNLKTPSTEEARERGRKGGIASGKARRKKKAINETLNELFSMPLYNGKVSDIEDVKSLAALKGQNITVQDAIIIAQVQRALKGDQKAARLLFAMMGDRLHDNNSQTENHSALIEAIRNRNHED